MRLEDYTADAICQAMDLSGFIEPCWTQAEKPTLRVVLTPSFLPELCITVACTGESAALSVVALAEQFWARRGEVCSPSDHEQVQLPAGAFEELLGLFQEAHTALDPERQCVWLDGMGSESCLVSLAGTQRLRAHVSTTQALGKFVGRLVELAWSGCQGPKLRNALARAASYLNIKYPLEVEPPQRPVTRLAILGTPDQRRDYLEMLRRNKKEKG